MLGKLLKYEFKATARTLLPLYAALLIISVISNLLLHSDFQIASVISITVFGALLMAVFIVTLILMIQRFYRNLLSDEGYLMFTLPVKTNRLIFSKMIVTFVWFLIAGIVGGISGLLLGWNSSFWGELREIWSADHRRVFSAHRRPNRVYHKLSFICHPGVDPFHSHGLYGDLRQPTTDLS